jgi:hypothetical protein
MKISFEPGDGSFEIILEGNEKLPAAWNAKGVIVLRKVSPHNYECVKTYSEILNGGNNNVS